MDNPRFRIILNHNQTLTAMKEKIRAQTLQLSRETIRQLDDDKLVHAGGGCDTTSFTTDRTMPQ
jgi:hypothetical protein